MTELTERVARLEGAYDHLATKEDIQALNADLTRQMKELTARMGDMREELGKLKGGATAIATGLGAVLIVVQLVLKYVLP